MNAQKKSVSGIGTLIVITVLLVLCMTVFAVLTLVSARSDLKISKKNADAISSYYVGDTRGVELIAAAAQGATLEQLQTLEPDGDVSLNDENGMMVLRARIQVDERRDLQLEAVVNLVEKPEIRVWRLVSRSDGEILIDDTLPIWQG